MEIFQQIAANAFNAPFFGALLFGALFGLVIGAIPGLSATMGIALLIPFTFDMPFMPAMAMLLGVYFGAVYGGSITAILFNTPGTPASAATTFDGYPLMQKGQAGRALSVAAFSMLCGGVTGSLMLIFLAPQISGAALKLGPAEFFAMALCAVGIIAAVSDGSFIKASVAALCGLLLSAVGMDGLTGYPRYIFGSASVMDGVPFIPVLIGLFAFTEVFNPASQETQQTSAPIGFCALPKLADIINTAWTNIKSAILGVFVGAAPGAGADIAAFMSYGMAKQSAKEGEEFGKGEIKGVAAVESAKTAATSGAMIPLLSLGIPGDSVTAVLIGAFILHGLQPGPLLFEKHPDISYSILFAVMLAHITVFVFAIFISKWMALALKMDMRFLKAAIFALAAVGAYGLRGNPADILIAVVFGIVGVVMKRNSYPVAPFLLALILGSMAEVNFRRALILSDGAYSFLWDRPITLCILAASAALIVFIRIKAARFKRKAAK